MMKRLPTAANGFTLIETLGAFAIVAISLIALFEAASGSSRSVSVADFDQTALRLGRSLLATAGVTAPLRLGTARGRFDNGFEWTEIAQPYALGQGDGAARSIFGAWLRIEIRAPKTGRGQDRSLILTSLKLLDESGMARDVAQ
jgi:general secretion pathway protein I